MAVWRGVRAYEAGPGITEWTMGRDAYEAIHVLEGRRCTSRVCQDARDRCDVDPQLAHLNWLTDVTGTKIGRWPVANVPSKLSATPAHIGGILDRAHPVMGRTTSVCRRALGVRYPRNRRARGRRGHLGTIRCAAASATDC